MQCVSPPKGSSKLWLHKQHGFMSLDASLINKHLYTCHETWGVACPWANSMILNQSWERKKQKTKNPPKNPKHQNKVQTYPKQRSKVQTSNQTTESHKSTHQNLLGLKKINKTLGQDEVCWVCIFCKGWDFWNTKWWSQISSPALCKLTSF